MIVVLSPAKNLNAKNSDCVYNPTIPDFLEDSQKLVNNLKRKSVKSIEALMAVNKKIATLNKTRFQAWQTPFTSDNSKAAIFTFRGEVYIGLNALDFDESDLKFAQSHLRILSGLYGLLRPLDLIQPYRLEMGTKLKIQKAENLYDFWNGKIPSTIQNSVKNHDHPLLINLASEQYFKSVQAKKNSIPFITPLFYELRAGQLKSINVYAKRARGLMANFIIKNRITDPEKIKKFIGDGYRFEKKFSKDNKWVFARQDSRS